MSDTIFTTVTLPYSNKTAVVKEGYGKHYFNAAIKAQGDASLLLKYLMVELVKVDGKDLTSKDIDSMHMRDVSYLSEVLTLMLSNETPEL